MMARNPSETLLHIDVTGCAADGAIQMRLAGELDSQEAERLHAGFADLVQRYAPTPIHVDATDLTFLDSAGTRALLICHRMAERAGSHMSIPQVHPSVFQVLRITGLLTVFDVSGQASSPAGSAARPAHAARHGR